MKRINYWISLMLILIGLPFVFTSCSSDDKEPTASKVIKEVDLYTGIEGSSEYASTIKFTYSGNNVSTVEIVQPRMEVYYRYPDKNNMSYTYYYENSSGDIKNDVMSMKLENDRCVESNSTITGKVEYTYSGRYLSRTASDNIRVDYNWQNGSLKTIDCSARLYSSQYDHSDKVVNNYNIDLNILPQIIDYREDYLSVMNTFAQLAGVTGTKSKYVVEDTYYDYKYYFDEKQRLNMMKLTVRNVASTDDVDTYIFELRYQDSN